MQQAALKLNLSVKKTRMQVFLTQMDEVVPWAALVELIDSYYPEGLKGRPPFSLMTMLRIHFMQQWFTLSDPAMEEAFFDTPLYREFARLEEFGHMPDESTFLRFRHRLEKHRLAEQMLASLNELLAERGLLLRAGMAVNATTLLHGQESVAFGDAGCQGIEKRPDGTENITWHVVMRPGNLKALNIENEADTMIDKAEKLNAGIPAMVGHPFRVVKRKFGFVKVRYRGLKKNTDQLLTLFALSNLWMVRGELIGAKA